MGIRWGNFRPLKPGPSPIGVKEDKDPNKFENKYYFRNQCGCFKKCQAKYLELKSKGTRDHRKAFGNDFKGCTRIEESLKEEGLLILNNYENESEVCLDPNQIAYFRAYGASCDNELIHFVLMMNKTHGLMMNKDAFICDFSFLRRSYPEDYKLIVLKKLIHRQHFDDIKHLVAIIIDLGLNSKEALFKYFPGFDYSKFCRYQAQVYSVIEQEIPERITFMKEAISSLTEKQWNALKAYYINNPAKLSYEALSKKMGISKESLRDRVLGAEKKIIKFFEKKEKEKQGVEIRFDLLFKSSSYDTYNNLPA